MKSGLDPKVRKELERRGVEGVRALLVSMATGPRAGTGRGASISLDVGVEVSRGEMEDWLRQNRKVADRWIKTGAIAAIVAALLAFLAWCFPIK